MPIKLYLCGICEHLHPWNWNGDCRDDSNRYTWERASIVFGVDEFDLDVATMGERVAADAS